MLVELKLRKIGNSVGLVLPKEVLAQLHAKEGDFVTVSNAPDGTLRVSATKPEVTRQMEVAQDIIERYRNTLRELAK